jgi:hypothetical protein
MHVRELIGNEDIVWLTQRNAPILPAVASWKKVEVSAALDARQQREPLN